MFDKDIVCSDAFTEMSSDAQNLYFHLGMHADDEGFVTPNGVMRMISSPPDALKLLAAKKFVIPFENGVVVITHFNQNNWLDSRRIRPTKYGKERKTLLLTDDHKYELSIGLASAKREECRVEENRVKASEKKFSDGFSESHLQECDEFGFPIHRGPAGGRKPRNKVAMGIQAYFEDQCKRHVGTKPIRDKAGYFLILTQMKKAELLEEDMRALVDFWFSNGNSPEKAVSITRCFSSRQINEWKVTYGKA